MPGTELLGIHVEFVEERDRQEAWPSVSRLKTTQRHRCGGYTYTSRDLISMCITYVHLGREFALKRSRRTEGARQADRCRNPNLYSLYPCTCLEFAIHRAPSGLCVAKNADAPSTHAGSGLLMRPLTKEPHTYYVRSACRLAPRGH